jgi:hypothetical protein
VEDEDEDEEMDRGFLEGKWLFDDPGQDNDNDDDDDDDDDDVDDSGIMVVGGGGGGGDDGHDADNDGEPVPEEEEEQLLEVTPEVAEALRGYYGVKEVAIDVLDRTFIKQEVSRAVILIFEESQI